MTSALKFRKIQPGLYGTGIHREPIGSAGHNTPDTVEIVIDYMSDVWWVREITSEADLTDYLGASFATLRDAKAYLMRSTNA